MNKYQENEDVKDFNDANKLNKTKRSQIDHSLQYYKDNYEYCRKRNFIYASNNKQKNRDYANRRYYWHRSWGGDFDCQFSLLRISLDAFN